MAEPDKMTVTVASALADALARRGMTLSMHMPGDERIDFYEGVAKEVILAINAAREIDYAEDWSGEPRTDPDDGNTYVLRHIEEAVPNLPERGFLVCINDIMGGHRRILDADEWVRWERVT